MRKRGTKRILAAGLLLSQVGLGHGQLAHRYLLGDEGNSNLHWLDTQANPAGWTVPLEGNGRDLQLIGNNRVLVSTPAGGYYEIDLAKGALAKQVKDFGAVQTARRLPNGHTLLAGDNLQGTSGVTVLELDSRDRLLRKTAFPGLSGLRILRLTPKGDFLFNSGDRVVEGDSSGKILWEAKLPGATVYKALRLSNGDTWVSTGYAKTLVLLSPAKAVLKTFPSSPLPAEANAHFFGDFQILANGNMVVTNWQNHGPGHGQEGIQLLEFDSKGVVVSSYRQDPARFSSIHSVLVLDGLDPARLHDERTGLQVPVPPTAVRAGKAGRTGRDEPRDYGMQWFLGRRISSARPSGCQVISLSSD